MWEPGTAAGYHPVTGWKVLGAIVEAVDGRPIDRYVRDEILTPLGARLDVPRDPARRRSGDLGDRIVPVAWTGHTMPVVDDDGASEHGAVPHRTVHNEPWHIAKVEPAGGMRGPAHELGRVLRVAARLRAGPVIDAARRSR